MLGINLFHPKTSLKPPYPTHHNPRVQPWPLDLTVKAAAATAPIAVDLGHQKTSETTLYQILGIHRDASQTAIKTAYRRLAKIYHPDLNSSNPSTGDFIEVNNAYATLSDPVAKAKYDLSLAAETARCQFRYSAFTGTNTTFRPPRRWETDQCW